MYPEISVLSFISAVLSVVPLTWYLQARNTAAVAIGIWLSVTHLVYAVDALVWADNAEIRAPVWCDLSTSLITGSRVALPAACLCICVHLERLASFCETSTPQAKRRHAIFEHLMAFGLPVVYTALHLIVQPRRFNLYYGFGCRPATYPTVATVFLVLIPPLLLSTATFVSAGIAWRHFLLNGVRFYGKRDSTSSLTRNLYLRLVGMALVEAAFSAVLIVVGMWGVLSPGLASLRDMSRDLREVAQWSPEAITKPTLALLRIEWSVSVVQSAVFFGLFACRMEVLRKGWKLISALLGSLNWSKSVQEAFEPSLTSVPTPALTEVDLWLDFQSAGTFTSNGRLEKSLRLTPRSSRPPSFVEDAPEEAVISAIAPAFVALESPSRASVIASSHNSLESNFLAFPPGAWPRTPRSVPARFLHGRLSTHSVEYESKCFESGWCESDVEVTLPRTAYVRPCRAEVLGTAEVCASEKRWAIYVTETR